MNVMYFPTIFTIGASRRNRTLACKPAPHVEQDSVSKANKPESKKPENLGESSEYESISERSSSSYSEDIF